MTTRPITLDVPEALYERLKRQAEQLKHTVEAEVLEIVIEALPGEEEISPELEGTLALMEFLDDKALWRAAESRLSKKESAKLQELHLKADGESLTEAEKHLEKQLTEKYERALLIRAEAAVLLKRRGYDISVLLKRP